MALRLKQPKVYPDEKLTLTLPGAAMREWKAYLACYAQKGQSWEPGAMLAAIITAFVKADKEYTKWRNALGPEKLDALLSPEPPRKSAPVNGEARP
jgi:hypothetical protein